MEIGLMQYDRHLAQAELRGNRPLSRSYHPAEGGESMNMVAARAEIIIRLILISYAVSLSEAPEFFLEKKTTDTPAVLPDGIPHIVVVGHNIFLEELYEKLQSWGGEHSATNCHWENAAW
jgi:probable phosphoglycerate mutase